MPDWWCTGAQGSIAVQGEAAPGRGEGAPPWSCAEHHCRLPPAEAGGGCCLEDPLAEGALAEGVA